MRPDLPVADNDAFLREPGHEARLAGGDELEREAPPIGYESAMPALVRAAAEA